jgi:DNA-binding Lrp family transcriptional regulator
LKAIASPAAPLRRIGRVTSGPTPSPILEGEIVRRSGIVLVERGSHRRGLVAYLLINHRTSLERPMQTFFVEIKCRLGKTYDVARALADREIASEIYSTAGNYDILAKFHVDDEIDIGHFIAENVQSIPEIADTHTIITFKAF